MLSGGAQKRPAPPGGEPPAAKARIAKAPPGAASAPAKAPVAKAKPPAEAKAPVVKAKQPAEGKASVVKAKPPAKAVVTKAAPGKAPAAAAAGAPAKAPAAVAKAPVGKAPVAKAPVAKAKVAKAPVAKAPVAKAKATQAPSPDEPAAKARVAAASPSPADSDEAETAPARRLESWQEFADVDPLYALLGEVGTNKVFAGGDFDGEKLERYLHKLFVQKAARKAKDWVEVWAAMDIPVDRQTLVLEPILSFGLANAPEGLGKILVELLKGHRVKTKTIEEAVQGAFKDKDDSHAILQDFFFGVYPKGPSAAWGWSRTGWSFSQWWKLLEAAFASLKPAGAFDALAALLDRIEAAGGTPLRKQPLLWKPERLAAARAQLCKFGGLENEDDLAACFDTLLR